MHQTRFLNKHLTRIIIELIEVTVFIGIVAIKV